MPRKKSSKRAAYRDTAFVGMTVDIRQQKLAEREAELFRRPSSITRHTTGLRRKRLDGASDMFGRLVQRHQPIIYVRDPIVGVVLDAVVLTSATATSVRKCRFEVAIPGEPILRYWDSAHVVLLENMAVVDGNKDALRNEIAKIELLYG